MRRLVRHGIVAASLCGLATATALATLPHSAGQVEAVPVVSAPLLQAPAAPPSPSATPSAVPRRVATPSRSVPDDEVIDARSAALAKDQKAIAKRSAKLKKAAKEKAAQEAEAEAVRKASEEAARRQSKIDYDIDSSSPREIGKKTLAEAGYDEDDFSCFDNIIKRESMWDIDATNASSGAYGIPQALPGSKMSSAGSDWRTNPATQVEWAIGYMEDRYGGICSAWSFKRSHGWY